MTQPREAAFGISWLPGGGVRSEPLVSSAAGQLEPSLLPADPPAFMATACNGHCHQQLIPWLGTSTWSCQEVLGVAVLLGGCCRVASNAAWKSCKSERQRPVHCMETLPGTATLLMPFFLCVFVFASGCTKFKVLLASPLQLLSSAHASRALLFLAVHGSLAQLHMHC